MQLQGMRFSTRVLLFFTSIIETQSVGCGTNPVGLGSSGSAISELAVTALPYPAYLDGIYAGDCVSSDLDGDTVLDGIKFAFVIQSGNIYKANQVFDHDPTCSVATGFTKIGDGSAIDGPELVAVDFTTQQVDGVPANLYLLSATALGSLDTINFLFYRDSASGNLRQLENAIDTYQGPQWGDWLTIVDVVGFAAAPTTFLPAANGAENGETSSLVELARVSQ